jgi:hypothetical protein
MTQQDPKVDGRTKRALDMAIARKQVSQESYRAVLAGTLALREAKAMGRDGAPAADAAQGISGPGTATETAREGQEQPANAPQDSPPRPVSRISKDDATQQCWCGCQQLTSPDRRWLPGHDQRAKGIIERAAREGKAEELSDRLKEYGAERGLV